MVEPELLGALLKATDPRVRAAAMRVVSHWHERSPTRWPCWPTGGRRPSARPAGGGPGPGRDPRPRSAELAMRALDRPIDRFLDYALWLTARELAAALAAEAAGGPVRLRRQLAAPDLRPRGGRLAGGGRAARRAAQGGQGPAGREESVLTLIATLGEPDDLATSSTWPSSESPLASERRVGLSEALAQAARQRKVRPDGRPGPARPPARRAGRGASRGGRPRGRPLEARALADEALELAGAEAARDAAPAGRDRGPGSSTEARSGRQALERARRGRRPRIAARDLAIAALVGSTCGPRADGAVDRLAEAPSRRTSGIFDPLPPAQGRPGALARRWPAEAARRRRQGRRPRRPGVGPRGPRADRRL